MIRLLFLISLFITSITFSQEAVLQFEHANQLYREGKYVEAVKMYEEIMKNGFESASLYYNLGNAYFKLNEIPHSIISYERARRLAPNDEDIYYNLRIANLHVVDKIESIPPLFFINWWNSFINNLSSDGWALVLVVSLWFTTIFTLLLIWLKRITFQRLAFIIAVLSFIFTVIAITGINQRLSRENNKNEAVIMGQVVSVKSAPDEKSTDLFILHAGVKIELLDKVEKWHKIKLADGKIGWLEENTFEII